MFQGTVWPFIENTRARSKSCPTEARAGGAGIIATGRSDFPNQVNNVLAFPGIFRSALDAHAPRITDAMKAAAAHAIAHSIESPDPEHILPAALDPEVARRVARAVAEEYSSSPGSDHLFEKADAVRHDRAAGRFQTSSGARLDYHADGDHAITVTHTFVPEHLRGKGLAAQLMEAVIEHAGKNRLSVKASCDYAGAYLKRKQIRS